MSSPRERAQSATRYSTRSQSPQKVDTTAAKKSMRQRQPSVQSEEFESEHTIDDGEQYPKPRKSARETHAEKTLINQKLGKYHLYLREEDRHDESNFKELYNEIKEFITNLASSKAMFDSRLYNDVKSMIRAYSEVWAAEEDEEAPTATKRKSSNTSSGRSTATSAGAASRVFSPDLAYDDESPQTTITTPADSPIRKKTVAFEEEEEEIEGGYLTPEYDYDDDDDDGDLLEFTPSLLAAAEKQAAALAQEEEEEDDDELSTPPPPPKPTRSSTRRNSSKRRISDAVDLDTPHKRRKRGQHVPASTVSRAEELRSTGKKAATTAAPVKQKGRPMKGVVQTIELEDDDDDGIGGFVGVVSPRKPVGRPRKFDVRAEVGEGLLVPDEIRDFDEVGFEEGMEEGDVKSWPGDPEFMFGETKFLEALKSRQIEEDLAGDDKKLLAKIRARPLRAMHERYRLPAVELGVVGKEKDGKSTCIVS
ncbi:MAG: hypothetical protein LQ350_005501 [Teloschistes chrysophthalmus]|nr:MAG: hypothetical protein LQ350_005501 [Niorma chrysophthalma]